MLRILVSLILCSIVSFAHAHAIVKKPLPAIQAFEFSTYFDKNKQLILNWNMAPGYYLYRDQLTVQEGPHSKTHIGKIELPKGKIKKDKVFGTFEVLMGELKIPVPIEGVANGILDLDVNYQGCSEEGYCYAPERKSLHIDMSQAKSTNNVVVTSMVPPETSQSFAEKIFDGESNFVIVLSFLGLGLLLAFTPCVLPMVPILSGIIVGHKHLTTMKAFFLSLAYVIGMAITYAIAGMVVAILGSHIQTMFQSPWAIVLGSALFVILALSLFGFYELGLPAGLQRRLTAVSNKQKGGSYLGVFLMGVISSLIVSPCVSAPLVGVLAYIAQTGDMVLGGVALLSLGFGMGIPLLLLGVSAGKLLPKAGPWMVSIERLFGILLLAVAIWMLSRIIPGPIALFLWAILLICSAMFMGVFTQAKNNWYNLLRGLGLVLLVYGIILIIGAVMGNSNPLQPWEKVGFGVDKKQAFAITIENMEQLDEKLAAAKNDHKPVMLDFYADWCSACVAMERYVFTKPEIQQVLSDFIVLRADVTKNDAFDKALLKRFNVIAPPTILFFNTDGEELAKGRIVGEVNKNEFLNQVHELGLAPM
ncbi:MAG: protein-disulfide reductase DsbD [Gammaproteobacteria bacterium]